jgi:hypothetical protein
MKRQMYLSRFAVGSVSMLLIALCQTAGARAGACRDISTVWTLSSVYTDGTTASRIYGDGLGSYTDGSSGVAATIKSCSTSDAVLSVGNRQLVFNFAGAFLGTSYSQPPAWTNGVAFASTPSKVKNCAGSPCTLLNIRDILNAGLAPRDQYYRLYTRLLSAFVAPDGKRYHLDMLNPIADITTPDVATSNAPYWNARVVVDHYPAANGLNEYWLVYPEALDAASPSPQNGTLLSDDRTVNFGEFSMPFYLNITAK